MKTATSKFVTAFDVIVVVGACFFGVFCGIVGVRYTQQINRKLREVNVVKCIKHKRISSHGWYNWFRKIIKTDVIKTVFLFSIYLHPLNIHIAKEKFEL